MRFINNSLDGFETAQVGKSGKETIRGVPLEFQENRFNPRALEFRTPSLPDTGHPMEMTIGGRDRLNGNFLHHDDALILNFHNQKPTGVARSGGSHIIMILRADQFTSISWTTKKKLFGGQKAVGLKLVAHLPGQPDATMSFAFDFMDPDATTDALTAICAVATHANQTLTIPTAIGTHRLEIHKND